VRRREFITLLGGAAAAWPLAARAQQPAMPLLGYLHYLTPRQNIHIDAAFRAGLKEMGYVEGQNVAIEYRWGEGRAERLQSLAEELARIPVKVLAASGGSVAALAAKAATSTIPIVFMAGDVDPVQAGLVASLARPGGNITGMSLMGGVLGVKRVEILREIVPNAAVIAVLVNPKNRNAEPDTNEVGAAVRAAGQKLIVLRASTAAEFDNAFASLVAEKANALIVTADGIFTDGRERLAALAVRYRVPVIYQWRELVRSGGLISYGASLADASRQLGVYAGRILKGTKPGDLPVMQPTKFDLVINLRAAKAIGLEVPPTLLARADEVIE
jgi:putative ABC transport system substrate-binding protein